MSLPRVQRQGLAAGQAAEGRAKAPRNVDLCHPPVADRSFLQRSWICGCYRAQPPCDSSWCCCWPAIFWPTIDVASPVKPAGGSPGKNRSPTSPSTKPTDVSMKIQPPAVIVPLPVQSFGGRRPSISSPAARQRRSPILVMTTSRTRISPIKPSVQPATASSAKPRT